MEIHNERSSKSNVDVSEEKQLETNYSIIKSDEILKNSYLTFKYVESEQEVEMIGQKIIDYSTLISDETTKNMAKSMMIALIYLIIAIKQDEEQNLLEVYKFIKNNNDDDIQSDFIKKHFNEMPKEHPANIHYKEMESLNKNQYISILAILQEKIIKYIEENKTIQLIMNTAGYDYNFSKNTIQLLEKVDTKLISIVNAFIKNGEMKKFEYKGITLEEVMQKEGIDYLQAILRMDLLINDSYLADGYKKWTPINKDVGRGEINKIMNAHFDFPKIEYKK